MYKAYLGVKMQVDLRRLRNIQRKIAKEVRLKEEFKIDEVKKIAGFDVAYFGDKAVCAAVVVDAKTLQILEKKTLVEKVPMNYIPGYVAFREGPLIMQLYYDIESEPDIIMVDGHGIAHPLKCGLATYVGVELSKPTIGVAKSLLVGQLEEDKIKLLNETVGRKVITRDHANPLFVSPGHLISIETAAKIASRTVVQPHKMPEPLHYAHKLAKKTLEYINQKKEVGQEQKKEELKQEIVETEAKIEA